MKFSYVVGAFNVAKFFEDGINQILQQTYSDFEIIIVDDGSTDGITAQLCDEYAERYEFIRIVHKKNGGLGSARNAGIDVARGDYICFYDVDDKISPTLLGIVSQYINCDTEVIMFGYNSYDVFYGINTTANNTFGVYSNNEIRNIYVDKLLGLEFNNGFVWNKVYRRDFLNKYNIRFENQRIQQDEVFNLKVYRHLKNLTIIPDVLYHYYIYNSGNTRSRFIEDRFEIYKSVKNAFLELYDYWQLNDQRMLQYVYSRFFNDIICTINFNCYHPKSPYTKQERHATVSEIINSPDVSECIEQMRKLNIIPTSSRKQKYFIALERKSFYLYNRIRIVDNTISKTKIAIRKLMKYFR